MDLVNKINNSLSQVLIILIIVQIIWSFYAIDYLNFSLVGIFQFVFVNFWMGEPFNKMDIFSLPIFFICCWILFTILFNIKSNYSLTIRWIAFIFFWLELLRLFFRAMNFSYIFHVE